MLLINLFSFSGKGNDENALAAWKRFYLISCNGLHLSSFCLFSLYIKVLQLWMERQFSYWVQLTAGVRQEGVLSTHLFSLFIDDILLKLNKSSLGCHIKSLCLNAIMYADDILLMSISVCDLQSMCLLFWRNWYTN